MKGTYILGPITENNGVSIYGSGEDLASRLRVSRAPKVGFGHGTSEMLT